MLDIERITEEVTRELLSELYRNQAPHSPAVAHRRYLLLFNRSDLPWEQLSKELTAWAAKVQLTALMPKWGQGMGLTTRLSNAKLAVECVSFQGDKNQAKAYLDQQDVVVIIGANPTLLGQITRMNHDSLPASLAVQALARSKPVMLLDNDLGTSLYRSKLQAMGLQMGGLDELVKVFPAPPPPSFISNPGSSIAPNRPLPVDCTGCTQYGHCVTLCSDRIQHLVEAGAARVSMALGMHPAPGNLAGMIDHTLLKAEATEAQVRTLCEEAAKHKFASVCINPSYVALAHQLLKGSGVMVCTVIGFPLGATDTKTKADETRTAIANGADEIDMVIHVGALKSKNHKLVEEDIRAVVQAAQGHTVKVIFETGLLSDEEKRVACDLSKKAGAHYVKTSTGFGPGGATEQDIALMRQAVGPAMGVKASGGVRDRETAEKMIRAGATRIGASASVAIVTTGKATGNDKY